MAVNCIGSDFGPNAAVQDVDAMAEQQRMAPKPQIDDGSLDQETQNKLHILELAKEKAVGMENFQEAKTIKATMEKIRTVGMHLQSLEERKRMAINNEDYEAA